MDQNLLRSYFGTVYELPSDTGLRLDAAARETSPERSPADLIPLRDGATIPPTSPDLDPSSLGIRRRRFCPWANTSR